MYIHEHSLLASPSAEEKDTCRLRAMWRISSADSVSDVFYIAQAGEANDTRNMFIRAWSYARATRLKNGLTRYFCNDLVIPTL